MLHSDTLDKMQTVTEENLGLFEIVLSGKGKFHLGRSSLPEEVANVVAFLASDAASYVTGTTISCAGNGF